MTTATNLDVPQHQEMILGLFNDVLSAASDGSITANDEGKKM
jgi:hypothetical protein